MRRSRARARSAPESARKATEWQTVGPCRLGYAPMQPVRSPRKLRQWASDHTRGVSRRWSWIRTAGQRDQWIRAVMNADHVREFEALDPSRIDVAEISGETWAAIPWRTRTQLDYPEFDLCTPPDEVPTFDLVICEQ